MTRGGARTAPVYGSGRSERKGVVFTHLPAAGFKGRVPKFPLPPLRRYEWVYEERSRHREFDAEQTEVFHGREVEIWKNAWRTPQAAAWASEPWRWPVVAEYCRVKTAIEVDPEASAALIGQLHRFRDQIGLTNSGLRQNQWVIDGRSTDSASEWTAPPRPTGTRRLRAPGEAPAWLRPVEPSDEESG